MYTVSKIENSFILPGLHTRGVGHFGISLGFNFFIQSVQKLQQALSDKDTTTIDFDAVPLIC